MFLLWRSWLAFTALIATVLTTLCILSVLQHNAVLSDLIRQRLSVVAQTAANPFRTVVDLGLPLSMMRNANEVLIRAQDLDENISSIHAFNPSGIVAHSTESTELQILSQDEIALGNESKNGKWSVETETEFHSYVRINNDQGNWVGGVLAIYTKDEFNLQITNFRNRIVFATLVLLIIFSLLTLVIFRIRLSGVINGAQMLHNWLLKQPYSVEKLDPDFIKLHADLEVANKNYHERYDFLTQFEQHDVDPPGLDPNASFSPELVMTSIPETSLARTYAKQLTPWATGIILLSALCLSYVVYSSVSESFEPELAKRTDLIAHIASANIQRGVDAGIPLEQMTGMDDYFDNLLQNFPEISFFGVATGEFIFKAGRWQHSLLVSKGKDVPIYPITYEKRNIGYIIIDPSPQYIALQFREVVLDLIVVILVVLLLAYEILVIVMSVSLTSPLNRLRHLLREQANGDFSFRIQPRSGSIIESLINKLSDRAAVVYQKYYIGLARLSNLGNSIDLSNSFKQLTVKFKLDNKPKILSYSYMNDIRLPLFLFAAADELAISFFPIFTRAAVNPITWLDPTIVIGLPLAGYLIAYTLASPFSRTLTDKWGHQKLILISLSTVLFSNVFMYFSDNVLQIIGLRTIAGGGYALAVLACQDYVIDVVPNNQRSKSLGVFSAALFGGIYSGTAIGGVLADRFGQSNVFLISALLVLISAIMFANMIPKGRRTVLQLNKPLTFVAMLKTIRNKRFIAIAVGLALPQAVMDQVFISYLFALQLDALNASAADIGRYLMVYFLMIMLAGILLSKLSSNSNFERAIIVSGSLLTGSSLLIASLISSDWTMLFASACCGFGYGLLRGLHIELAIRLSEYELKQLGQTTVLGALRLIERGGSILGLLIIAAIASYFGLLAAIGSIGILILIGLVIFASYYLGSTNIRSENEAVST